MKKILIIEYFYKPIISNQSYRYDKLLENIPQNVSVDILTSHHYGIPKYSENGNIQIFRTNSRFLKKKLDEKEKHNQQIASQKNTILNKIMKKIMWPDFAFLWIFAAYRLGKKLFNNNSYDLVFSVSFPFSSHVVGYLLKRKYKKFDWIVDYIDPFSIIEADENPANNVKIYKTLNKYIENKVNNLSTNIFILEESYHKFLNTFPNAKKKITVIPPMLGIDEEKYKSLPSFLFDKDGIVLLYAGSLYKDIRNPLEFLKLFEKIIERKPNTYLYFVGDLKDCKDIVCKYKIKYSDNIFISGCLSREDTIMRIKGCDVLINLANLSSVQLPGKVVEYLYSGKKIINYSEKEKDNSTKFFIKYSAHGQVLNITRDNYDIEEVLNFITSVNFFENINIEPFKPKNIAKIYFKTIGEI